MVTSCSRTNLGLFCRCMMYCIIAIKSVLVPGGNTRLCWGWGYRKGQGVNTYPRHCMSESSVFFLYDRTLFYDTGSIFFFAYCHCTVLAFPRICVDLLCDQAALRSCECIQMLIQLSICTSRFSTSH